MEPRSSSNTRGRVNDNFSKRPNILNELDISHFDLNAILRGIQLTLVGAHRAMQNPDIFTSEHYRQAACAILIGVMIRLVIKMPILGARVVLWILSRVFPLNFLSWGDTFVSGIQFIEVHVLQLPLFLMFTLRYTVPTLDSLFMQSLEWVDGTNTRKRRDDHAASRHLYYSNLKQYPLLAEAADPHQGAAVTFFAFLRRFARKGGISIAVYALSFLPIFGRCILPAASFYALYEALGLGVAGLSFGAGLFLPKTYLVVILQTYFASRSMTRELLEPYFARIPFSKTEKKNWFKSREGVLFGFGFGFYALTKLPLFGVFVHGIAEASTAYLITKITDPPPPPTVTNIREYAASQQAWANKYKFLSIP